MGLFGRKRGSGKEELGGPETLVMSFGRQVSKYVRRRRIRKAMRICSRVYSDDAERFLSCTLRLSGLRHPGGEASSGRYA